MQKIRDTHFAQVVHLKGVALNEVFIYGLKGLYECFPLMENSACNRNASLVSIMILYMRQHLATDNLQ